MMGKIKTFITVAKKGLHNRNYFELYVLGRVARYIPDEIYLKRVFKLTVGYRLNLKNPKTYNEKLQWLKLHDHNPLYPTMVDKHAVKDYVAKIIGSEYIIPTLEVYNNPDEIDFNKLPSQFVLKCNHDSGGLVVCKDKSKLDEKSVRERLLICLKRDFYWLGREWPYKNIKKRIIAEQYMEDDETKELRDYKFFCFNGVVKLMFIATDRQNREEPYFDFYDTQFNHLDLIHGHPNAPIPPQKPYNFELMIELAEKISKGLPHVRVDFYECNRKIYFGEITLYHHNGTVPFKPEYWDRKLGDLIELTSI